MENGINAAPFVGIIGSVIMWCGLIFTLSIIKGFIVQGVNMAISEWLLKIADKNAQERICRWLGDEDIIMSQLQEMGSKTK